MRPGCLETERHRARAGEEITAWHILTALECGPVIDDVVSRRRLIDRRLGLRLGRYSENFEDAIDWTIGQAMADADRDHAIQPVIGRVRGFE